MVDFPGMGPRQAVRPVLYHHQAGSFNGFLSADSRGGDRKYPVGISMYYQRRNIDTRKVLAEIGSPLRNTIEGSLG